MEGRGRSVFKQINVILNIGVYLGGGAFQLDIQVLLYLSCSCSPANRYFNIRSYLILSIAFSNDSFGGALNLIQNFNPSLSNALSPEGRGGVKYVHKLCLYYFTIFNNEKKLTQQVKGQDACQNRMDNAMSQG